MMANPRIGQELIIHYGDWASGWNPWHGLRCRVVVRGRPRKAPWGKWAPRNHGVATDQGPVVIPCGHLQKPKEGDPQL